MSPPRRVAPTAPSRRGWCPSLARPMPTGDGLLARVHPPLGCLTPTPARAVAAGARRFGNGHIDVTARANLQIRGVTDATRGGLAEALAAVELGDVRNDGGPQRLTLTSPLAGLAASPIDILDLARTIEAIGLAIPGLPPKTLIAVEAKPAGLGPAEADAHLVATAKGLALHLAGDAGWWHVPVDDAPAVLDAALRGLAASGRRRMRDLSAEDRAALVAGLRPAPMPPRGSLPRPGLITLDSQPAHVQRGLVLLEGFRTHRLHLDASLSPLWGEVRSGGGSAGLRTSRVTQPPPSPTPPHTLDGSRAGPRSAGEEGRVEPADGNPVALLVEAPFGRCTADALETLADAAESLGTHTLRLSATRGFLLVANDEHAAETVRNTLAAAGFLTHRDDPRGAVAACPGAPACASGSTPTLHDAAGLADVFRPFAARGLRAHVSGCAKGCAHPGAADLTLVGRDGGYDVVLAGRADGLPARHLPFEAARERLRRADSALSLAQIFSDPPPGSRTP